MAERKVHPVKVNPETGEKTKVCSFCEGELSILVEQKVQLRDLDA